MRQFRAVVAVVFVSIASTAMLIGQTAGNSKRVIVVLDDFHIAFRSTARLRDTLTGHALRALAGHAIGLVTTGYSSVAVAPTIDADVLASAVRRVAGGSLRPWQLVDNSHSAIAERLRRARIAIATVRDAVRAAAAGTPGVMIYIGGGWGDDELAGDRAGLVTTAARVNMRIHAFDSRTILDEPMTPIPSSERGWASYSVKAQDTLRMVAERTGGRYVSAPWDVHVVMSEIAREN